jgi:hypothetical protein
MIRQISELEKMAREMIGDGGAPNLFFVSQGGVIITVSRSFEVAYSHWRGLPRDIETALEGRNYGVICSTSPIEDDSPKLRTYDDSEGYRRMYPRAAAS